MVALKHKPSSRNARPPFSQVFQFKITMRHITPLIWRRIQVPETYSFWDLHIAIQDAMGWTDSHLHRFDLVQPKTGKQVSITIPAETYGEDPWENELTNWKEYISDYFSPTNNKAVYIYDYGDNWEHDVEFEGPFSKKPRLRYPKCIAGEKTCPPEDCGGTGGYEELVEAMKNPKHPRRQELVEWLGHEYHPDMFHPVVVRFDNPRERWEMAFGKKAEGR